MSVSSFPQDLVQIQYLLLSFWYGKLVLQGETVNTKWNKKQLLKSYHKVRKDL